MLEFQLSQQNGRTKKSQSIFTKKDHQGKSLVIIQILNTSRLSLL